MKKLNHNHFHIALLISALIITGFVVGSGADLTVAELISTKLFNAAVPLSLGCGFLYFLRGTEYDVLDDVFNQHNVAAAIVIYAIFEVLSRPFGKVL